MNPNGLIFNPSARFDVIGSNDPIEKVRVTAPVKGKGLQCYDIERSHGPLFYLVVHWLGTGRPTDGLNPTDRECEESLKKMGVLISEEEVSQPVKFSCVLEEAGRAHVPLRYRGKAESGNPHGPWIVNPTFEYGTSGGLPLRVVPRVLFGDWFEKTTGFAWIEDARTGVLVPYSVPKEHSRFFESLKAGEPFSGSVPEEMVSLLRDSDILVSKEEWDNQRINQEGFFRSSQVFFEMDGYLEFRRILQPFFLGALRKYYRRFLEEGHARMGDWLVDKRYTLQNEPMARYLHYELCGLVGLIAGRPVKPSQCYFSSYEPGAVLKKHKDREQSVISVSILIDYFPEPKESSPWALFLEREGPPAEVFTLYQGLGDAVLYHGMQMPHYRHALPEGQRSSSLFLLYVYQDYEWHLH